MVRVAGALVPWCGGSEAWKQKGAGARAGAGAGAGAGAVAGAGADAGAGVGVGEVAIFRAREGAGGHQMRGGRGPFSVYV